MVLKGVGSDVVNDAEYLDRWPFTFCCGLWLPVKHSLKMKTWVGTKVTMEEEHLRSFRMTSSNIHTLLLTNE